MNLDSWSRLTEELRALLTETMVEHERRSYIALRALAEEEEEKALDKGVSSPSTKAISVP